MRVIIQRSKNSNVEYIKYVKIEDEEKIKI